MKIRIYCVGKIKEKYYQEAINEFKKRLKSFCQLEIIEVKDEKESCRTVIFLLLNRMEN